MKLTRKTIVVAIALAVAALHVVVGPGYSGPFPAFVHGYLIDLLLPFAMVLLMGLVEHRAIRHRAVRALAVFGVGAATETLQYFGVPIFGRTFDPLDFVAFALGVAGALLFESTVLSRLLPRVSGERGAGEQARRAEGAATGAAATDEARSTTTATTRRDP